MRDEAGEGGGDRDFGFWRDKDITCVGIGNVDTIFDLRTSFKRPKRTFLHSSFKFQT